MGGNNTKTVLIVDDSLLIRGTLRLILESHGYKVIGEAENGKVAVKLFQELQPDIVTMDVGMPEMDGLTATRLIRDLNPASNIVMISAMDHSRLIDEAMSIGVKGFISKPFDISVVIRILDELGEQDKTRGMRLEA